MIANYIYFNKLQRYENNTQGKFYNRETLPGSTIEKETDVDADSLGAPILKHEFELAFNKFKNNKLWGQTIFELNFLKEEEQK